MTRLSWRAGALPALLLAAACTAPGTPVPVVGDVQLLAGRWEGTYQSDDTGRMGSIVFELKAGTDSAFGDVVMVPARAELPPAPRTAPAIEATPQPARVITISFVRCVAGEVSGHMDPYEDPDTHERVYTSFEGRLRGNTLAGTFVSVYKGSDHRTGGTWSVNRK
jgi:hypothetical protein